MKFNNMGATVAAAIINLIFMIFCFIGIENKFGSFLVSGIGTAILWWVVNNLQQSELDSERTERRSKMTEKELKNEDEGHIKSQLVCVHCQKKGCVRFKPLGRQTKCDNCGISGSLPR